MSEDITVDFDSLNNLKEDTGIPYLDRIEQISSEEFSPIFEVLVFTKEIKRIVIASIAEAEGKAWESPFIILLPAKWFGGHKEHLTYPIMFRNVHRVYIVPYIRDLMLYEQV